VVCSADLVLVVAGVRPDSELAAAAGATLGARNAIAVDRQMNTGLPGVYAAGDCVVTWHRLLGETYLPLGATAHKQGRIAGGNALGGHREYGTLRAPGNRRGHLRRLVVGRVSQR
jgi:NADPH-dependent 2,4-dienoyl-CoA reductase/sulfur reductase-like enzyme